MWLRDMLELLQLAELDPLWKVTARLTADPRPEVLDLVVGVYRDENGRTPVMQAVSEAERRLANNSTTKAYLGLAGNRDFNRLMTELVLGSTELMKRAATIQTVAGTGALRLLAELVAQLHPDAVVWMSDPAYINHAPIMTAAGLRVRHYTYLGRGGSLNAKAMLSDLSQTKRGDIVLLQGCCHNPTGVDLPAPIWAEITRLAGQRGLIPLIDIAYLGLGNGMDEDGAGLRFMTSQLDEVLIATSCSKNFGLYRDRAGCCIVVGKTPGQAQAVMATLQNIARANYSMPPDHGASIVVEVLNDERLTHLWRSELNTMRERINTNRLALAAALDMPSDSAALGAIAEQRGMFSLLPLNETQMERLAHEHAIFGTACGRINVAGFRLQDIPRIASAIHTVRQH
jgi:aspartate/tyrosine/aromatic aminotransferase